MKNKSLIIMTGATSGIGKFIADKLRHNFDLALILRPKKIKTFKKKFTSSLNKKNIYFFGFDLSHSNDYSLIKRKIKFNDYKSINLIFCAGTLEKSSKTFDYDDWIKTFNTNVFSHLEIFNQLNQFLSKSKLTNKIIFFSGGGAASSFPDFPAYSASKTALVRSIENLSEKFSKKKFNIFAVAPGAVETKMLKKVLRITSVGTKSKKEDVYNFISYALNADTSSFHGRLINIKDSIKKINNNKKNNFLKLRRVDEYLFNRDG